MSQYIDIDIYGLSQQDTIIYHQDADAIKHALLLWLTYSRRDLLMNPSGAGFIDIQIFKNLSHENIETFKLYLLNTIEKYFNPSINIIQLEVEPDYVEYRLLVDIVYRVPEYNIEDTLTFAINTNYTTPQFNYIYIDYTDDNLYNFVITTKENYSEHKLIFDYTLNKWRWGKYVFNNFSFTDSRFTDILIIINNT